MFLQRFTSEASPISTAADSFFFHTWERQAVRAVPHVTTGSNSMQAGSLQVPLRH